MWLNYSPIDLSAARRKLRLEKQTSAIKPARGFTLIEVMVAIALLSVIMFQVSATTTQMLNSKDRVEDRDLFYQVGRVALRKIEDDLRVAFLVKSSQSKVKGFSASSGELKSGWRTFFIGKNEGEHDSIKFTTLSHLRLYKNAKESEQTRVAYLTRRSEDNPEFYDLIRVEMPWLDGTTEVEGRQLVLAESIREFNVEYFDVRKEEWIREWDTEQIDWKERLPSAVRLTLSFPDPDDEEQSITFTSGVFLALAKAPISF